MKGFSKFLLIGYGTTIALLVLGMVIATQFMDIQPDEVVAANLITQWMWYRVAFYLVLVVMWPLVARGLTSAKKSIRGLEKEEAAEIVKKRDIDYKYIKSQWWKVASLLAFFEIVIVRQFGL